MINLAIVPFDNDRYYAYADGSYRAENGKKVSKAAAFMLGLPSRMADYLLILVLVCMPASFLTPVFTHRRERPYGVNSERRARHLLRQGLIILLAYLMLIDPVCLQQLAYASSQYEQIETNDWGTENRTIEYQYDANGSCTQKVTKESSSGDTVETRVYDIEKYLASDVL